MKLVESFTLVQSHEKRNVFDLRTFFQTLTVTVVNILFFCRHFHYCIFALNIGIPLIKNKLQSDTYFECVKIVYFYGNKYYDSNDVGNCFLHVYWNASLVKQIKTVKMIPMKIFTDAWKKAIHLSICSDIQIYIYIYFRARSSNTAGFKVNSTSYAVVRVSDKVDTWSTINNYPIVNFVLIFKTNYMLRCVLSPI